MQAWLSGHPLISYLLILGFTVYIFQNVFRPQAARLPILKTILLYLTMIIGSGIMLIFQIDKLPIIQCMGIAVLMMFTLRGRQLYDKWKEKSVNPSTSASKKE